MRPFLTIRHCGPIARHYGLTVLLAFTGLCTQAQTDTLTAPNGSSYTVHSQEYAAVHLSSGDGRITERQWLWGIGHISLLDTYLSPLTYNGTNFSVMHSTERRARRLGRRLTLQSLYTGHLDYTHSPTDDGKALDAELTAAGSLLYNFDRSPHWRWAAGSTLEASGGFTYNTRGSNNPAQGRLGISLSATALAEYSFKFFSLPAAVRLQADMQVLGVQFSPQYGQSYYEIFSLGHTGGIIHLTHPGNCPSFRLRSFVTLPVRSSRLTLGYLADIRQSRLGGLKRHAWRNSFMIGYTRYLRIVH